MKIDFASSFEISRDATACKVYREPGKISFRYKIPLNIFWAQSLSFI